MHRIHEPVTINCKVKLNDAVPADSGVVYLNDEQVKGPYES